MTYILCLIILLQKAHESLIIASEQTHPTSHIDIVNNLIIQMSFSELSNQSKIEPTTSNYVLPTEQNLEPPNVPIGTQFATSTSS